MKNKLLFVLWLAFATCTCVNAQLNVGSTAAPDSTAALQITSSTKGMLFPNLTTVQRDAINKPAPGLVVFNTTTNQLEFNAGTAASKSWAAVGTSSFGQQLPLVSLSATNLPSPLTAHTKGIMVYNTAAASSGTTAVAPGMYINDGTKWQAYLPGTPSVATFTLGTIACTGTLAGTYNMGIAMAASNTKIVTITTATVGTYTASTDLQNGVLFTASGSIAATGNTNITLTANGTPTAAGTFTYTVTIGGQTCGFSVTFTTPAATFTASTLACTGTLAGNYNSGIAMTASNYKAVAITVATIGSYSASTNTVNGVTFSTTGFLSTSGANTINLAATGTPTANGTFTYTVTISGQTCTFDVTYTTFGVATFTFDCASATVATGSYYTGIAMTASNTKVINVNVSAAGTYSFTTGAVNGITYAASGTFNSIGATTVTLTATGMPTAAGANTYTVTGGGSTCTFSVTAIKSTFTGTLGFTGNINSTNGSIAQVAYTTTSGISSNIGATSANILSGGNFIAPVTGYYTFTGSNVAYTYSGAFTAAIVYGVSPYPVIWSTTKGYVTTTAFLLNQGQSIEWDWQACLSCSPISNFNLTAASMTVTLQ